jgi:hypothetical protein
VERDDPNASARVFEELLREDDPHAVEGALTLLADLAQRGRPERENKLGGGGKLWWMAPLTDYEEEVFRAWFVGASSEEKLVHRKPLLRCVWALGARKHGRDVDAGPDSYVGWLPLTRSDDRWTVASVPDGSGEGLVFFWRDSTFWPADSTNLKLAARVDVARGFIRFAGGRSVDAPRSDDESLAAQVRIPLSSLESMLDDAVPEVRWGAGLILGLAGREDALPVVREWVLKKHKLSRAGEQMLADLFGSDWRKGPVFAGGASSAPSAAQP